MTETTQPFLPFHFHTMDASIELLLPCEEHQKLRIHEIGNEWFGREEKRFGLGIADSEINLLNTLAGECCLVSNTMLEVLFLAEMYQAITDGKYTPLLYKEGTTAKFAPAPARESWKVNPMTKSVTLPQHTQIQLQGIEKSWSLKRLSDYFKKTLSLTTGLMLSEGDVSVWGQSDSQQNPWRIGLQSPWNQNAKLGAIVLSEGALSTYSPLEDDRHSNAGSDVLQCTVLGHDLVECHVWARIIGSLGIEAGLSLLAKRSKTCEALILSKQEKLHFYGQASSIETRWHDLHVDHFHWREEPRGDHVDSFV